MMNVFTILILLSLVPIFGFLGMGATLARNYYRRGRALCIGVDPDTNMVMSRKWLKISNNVIPDAPGIPQKDIPKDASTSLRHKSGPWIIYDYSSGLPYKFERQARLSGLDGIRLREIRKDHRTYQVAKANDKDLNTLAKLALLGGVIGLAALFGIFYMVYQMFRSGVA